jgi:hypothetical protein
LLLNSKLRVKLAVALGADNYILKISARCFSYRYRSRATGHLSRDRLGKYVAVTYVQSRQNTSG